MTPVSPKSAEPHSTVTPLAFRVKFCAIVGLYVNDDNEIKAKALMNFTEKIIFPEMC